MSNKCSTQLTDNSVLTRALAAVLAFSLVVSGVPTRAIAELNGQGTQETQELAEAAGNVANTTGNPGDAVDDAAAAPTNTVSIPVELNGAYITYADQTIAAPATSFNAPAGTQLAFTVAADTGYKDPQVSISLGSFSLKLDPNEEGLYRIDGGFVSSSLKITVSATQEVTGTQQSSTSSLDSVATDSAPAGDTTAANTSADTTTDGNNSAEAGNTTPATPVTITFNAGNFSNFANSFTKTISTTAGAQVTLPSGTGVSFKNTNKYKNHELAGWATTPNATSATYQLGETITAPSSNLTLYPYWVKKITLAPTLNNIDAYYIVSDLSYNIVAEGVLNGSTVLTVPGAQVTEFYNVNVFVKAKDNYLLTKVSGGADPNNYMYSLAGEGRPNMGQPGNAISNEMLARMRAAGYTATFGWGVRYKNTGDTLSVVATAEQPTPSATITSDKTEGLNPGDVITLTATVKPGDIRNVFKAELNGNPVIYVNGHAYEVTNATRNEDSSYTGTITYTVTRADCMSGVLMASAQGSFKYSYAFGVTGANSNSAILSSAASIASSSLNVLVSIAPSKSVSYVFTYKGVERLDHNSYPEAVSQVPVDNTQYQKGDNVTVTSEPSNRTVRDNINGGTWTFDGWYLNNTKTTQASIDNEGLVFTGTWTFTGNEDSLRYEANGGTGQTAATSGRTTEDVTVAQNGFVRPGYHFTGWSTKANVSDEGAKSFAAGEKYQLTTGDDVLYALWEEDSPVTINYTAQEGGSVSSASEQVSPVSGTAQGSTATASDGYYFTGWQDEQGNIVSNDATFVPSKNADNIYTNATYTATFKAKENIVIAAKSASATYDGAVHTVSGFENEDAEGIKFTAADGKIYTVTGLSSTATATNVADSQTSIPVTGTAKVTDQDGNDVTNHFILTVAPGSLVINAKEVTVAAQDASKTYGNPDPTLTATVTGTLENDTVAYTVMRDEGANAGTYTIRATGNENQGNYHVTFTNATFTINKRGYSITTGSKTVGFTNNFVYYARSSQYTITGLAQKDDAKVKTTGVQIYVGTSDNTYEITWKDGMEQNYYLQNATLGKLTVTPNKALNISPVTRLTYYNGQLEKLSGYSWFDAYWNNGNRMMSNVDVIADVYAEGLHAGFYDSELRSYKVVDSVTGQDLTSQFDGVSFDGKDTLHIEQQEFAVRTLSATKEYDGSPLTAVQKHVNGWLGDLLYPDRSITSDYDIIPIRYSSVLSVGKEVVKINGSSLTDVGSIPNTFTMDWNSPQTTALESDYIYHPESNQIGTLTVTPNTSLINVTAQSKSKTYDGTALTNDKATVTSADNDGEVTVEGFDKFAANGLTWEATLEGSQTNFGTSENKVTSFKIFDKDGKDVTSYFTNIQTNSGTLSVTKATLTVTTQSASRVYNGQALTADGSYTGLVAGETLDFKVTGSQTEVGSSTNYYQIDWSKSTAQLQNYEINENFGTLVVTESTDEIAVWGLTSTYTYDGQEHAALVQVGNLPTGYTVDLAQSGLTATDTPNVYALSSDTHSDAGEYTKQGAGLVIVNAQGTDVTASVKLKDLTNTMQPAKLVIKPAPLYARTQSLTYTYDGSQHTGGEVEIAGLVNGETLAAHTQLESSSTGDNYTPGKDAGVSANNFVLDWNDQATTAKESNYQLVYGSTDTSQPFETGAGLVTVLPRQVTVTANGVTMTYGDALPELTATVEGLVDNETVTYTVTSDGNNNAGIHTLTPSGDALQGNVRTVFNNTSGFDEHYPYEWSEQVQRGNYQVTYVPGTLTINQRPYSVTTQSATKSYDGNALVQADATIDGLVDAGDATLTTTGTQTEVGTSDNTYSIAWKDGMEQNYLLQSETLGTLTVEPNDTQVTITAASATKAYDGTALTQAGEATVEGLPEGITASVVSEGSQTTAGQSPNAVTSFTFKDATGNDVTGYFNNVVTVDGMLTVEPATLTVSTSSATQEYNGNALVSRDGSMEGLVNGETATFNVVGSQTVPGSSTNTYTIDWNGTADPLNYNVVEKLGTLSVTTRGELYTIDVTSNSGEFTYDGQEHTVSGFETLSFTVDGHTYTITGIEASTTQTQVGTYEVTITGTPVVLDQNGNDVTSQFKLNLVPGTLTINEAAPQPGEPTIPTTPTTPTTPTPAPGAPTATIPAALVPVATALQNVVQVAQGQQPTELQAPNAPTQTPNAPTQQEETIADNQTPLAGAQKVYDCWVHWWMIVGMIVTAIYGIALIMRRNKFTKNLNERQNSVLNNKKGE